LSLLTRTQSTIIWRFRISVWSGSKFPNLIPAFLCSCWNDEGWGVGGGRGYFRKVGGDSAASNPNNPRHSLQLKPRPGIKDFSWFSYAVGRWEQNRNQFFADALALMVQRVLRCYHSPRLLPAEVLVYDDPVFPSRSFWICSELESSILQILCFCLLPLPLLFPLFFNVNNFHYFFIFRFLSAILFEFPMRMGI